MEVQQIKPLHFWSILPFIGGDCSSLEAVVTIAGHSSQDTHGFDPPMNEKICCSCQIGSFDLPNLSC